MSDAWPVRLSAQAGNYFADLPAAVQEMVRDLLDLASHSPLDFPQGDKTDPDGVELRRASVGSLTVVYLINRQMRHLSCHWRSGDTLESIGGSINQLSSALRLHCWPNWRHWSSPTSTSIREGVGAAGTASMAGWSFISSAVTPPGANAQSRAGPTGSYSMSFMTSAPHCSRVAVAVSPVPIAERAWTTMCPGCRAAAVQLSADGVAVGRRGACEGVAVGVAPVGAAAGVLAASVVVVAKGVLGDGAAAPVVPVWPPQAARARTVAAELRDGRDRRPDALPTRALRDEHENQALAEYEKLAAKVSTTGQVWRSAIERLADAVPAMLQRTTEDSESVPGASAVVVV
ncbi:hypothetical protein [Streptacidiphilus sp. EB129]|uniref:hypothetical protein n=1 Tax=Streptacidiphilus sp. EB129 TaxID=3156262 RepID=UPI0035165D43